MKKLASTLVGVGLALIIFGVYTHGHDGRCEARFDRMNAVLKCIDQAPCQYNAMDLYEGRRASRYYVKHCELYELHRSQRE